MSSNENDNASQEINPHKELLKEAADQIHADQVAREKARPQNVGQGTLGLVGDSLGGAAMGAAAVVMGPVQGYKQNGAKGIIGGALGGLAVGVASATFGIGSGIAKFAHGASKTASGFQSSEKDPKLIVQDDRAPIQDVYHAERNRLYSDLQMEHSKESANASMHGLAAPVDNKLYKVLEISPDATPGQIRKAYYRMAQQYHPDKHPDSPEATAKFQEISEAYQVLSDPVKREEYHRLGAEAAADGAMMDPKALFALMFSDFEHIVGDLATSTILATSGGSGEAADPSTDSGTDPGADPGADPGTTAGAGSGASAGANVEAMEARLKKKKEFQQMREAHLVKMLNRRLEPWLNHDENTFIEHAKHEVLALREEPFGRDLLKTVGYWYKKKASKMLDGKGALSGVTSFFDDLGDKAHSFKTQIRALEGGVKAMATTATAGENESVDETARREAVNTLGAVWLAAVVDIESTMRHVLDKILETDSKHAKKNPELKRKAEGVLILGKIFEQA